MEWRELVAKVFVEWSHARFDNEHLSIEQRLKEGDFPSAIQAAQALLKQCQQAGEKSYIGAGYDFASANLLLGRVLRTSGAATKALPYLQEAQQRFEAIGVHGERMVSVALTERGSCLERLGQLDAAEILYEKSIIQQGKNKGNTHGVALGKQRIATIRWLQKRHGDAVLGFQQALELFMKLGDLLAAASVWHKIGMCYTDSRDFEEAEKAYQQSISINNQKGNKVGEAENLSELGNLYNYWGRSEQALIYDRRGADIYENLGHFLQEGVARNNVADTLIKLSRYDEAREELLLAIKCQQGFGHLGKPWNTWSTLHSLEKISGNLQAASDAWQKALLAYLAYRRDGGENHDGSDRLALAVGVAIQKDNTSQIEQMIEQLSERVDWQEHKNFLQKLQAILGGERDLALAEDEGLHFSAAAELIVLLESLAE